MIELDFKIELENKRPGIFNFPKTFQKISKKENAKPLPRFFKFPLLKFGLTFAVLAFLALLSSGPLLSQPDEGLGLASLMFLLLVIVGVGAFLGLLAAVCAAHALLKKIKIIIKTIKKM